MFDSLNRVTLIGTLGADPEVRSFQNGGRVCNIRVACSESWKDRNTGERKERTEWITVAVFSDGLIGLMERFLRKGSKVYVEGKFQTRKWQDQNGNDRYSTEVVVQGFGGTVKKLDKDNQGSGGGSGGGQSGGYGGGSSGGSDWGRDGSSGGSGGGSNYDDLDDDIPF
ncbi:single-stranded DNA-binding protein [Erythrobacter phage vB_EliS_R6L]|nr:single-stranded DNA-binding protein [Erythrobacter phage vB_EliS_R6L]